LIGKNTNSALGHYYLGMNLGQVADAHRGMGGLKIVGQMETEFKLAAGLDPKIDHGGPDRSLGLLYLETPGWPISIGNKTKARQHLQKALKLIPDFPENHLQWLEAEIKWGEKANVARDFKVLQDLWPDAHKALTGDDWAADWADWDKRRAEIEKKLNEWSKPPEPHKKL
jgi:hypothetical protein